MRARDGRHGVRPSDVDPGNHAALFRMIARKRSGNGVAMAKGLLPVGPCSASCEHDACRYHGFQCHPPSIDHPNLRVFAD